MTDLSDHSHILEGELKRENPAEHYANLIEHNLKDLRNTPQDMLKARWELEERIRKLATEYKEVTGKFYRTEWRARVE